MTTRKTVFLIGAAIALSLMQLDSTDAQAGNTVTTSPGSTNPSSSGQAPAFNSNTGNGTNAPAPLDCSIESHPDCPRGGTTVRGWDPATKKEIVAPTDDR